MYSIARFYVGNVMYKCINCVDTCTDEPILETHPLEDLA